MGNWPGAAADRWWASLPPARREQIHRWIHPDDRRQQLPKGQLALDEAAQVTASTEGR